MWHAQEERKVYKVFVGNPEGKRPLRRPRRRWEDGIREIGWGDGLASTGSRYGPVASYCECGNEPSSGSCTTELVSNCYITITLLSSTVKCTSQVFKFKKL
jgi:hypothetical protein